MPSNGPPQNVPVARQRTAAWLRAATTSSTSKRMSGIAVKVWLKKERTSSGARSVAAQRSDVVDAARGPALHHRVHVTRRDRVEVGAGHLARARAPSASAHRRSAAERSPRWPRLPSRSSRWLLTWLLLPLLGGVHGPARRSITGHAAAGRQAELISSATEPRPSISSSTRSSAAERDGRHQRAGDDHVPGAAASSPTASR